MVLVDLDHFKQVNERHGHLVGDEVLRRVGMALRQAIRSYDFVARYVRGARVLDAGCGEGYGTARLTSVAAEVSSLSNVV